MKQVTLIVPCYNEAEVLPEFHARVKRMAGQNPGYAFTVLYVNDGSLDSTPALLDHLAETDPCVKVLHLAHNQGHQTALTAGMDFAPGDILVTLDADLQDPPEVIPDLLAEIERGISVVHAQRRARHGETPFKRATAAVFYRFLNAIARQPILQDCGDFRAFTRPVLIAARGFREPHRFLRGTFMLLGFTQSIIVYDRAPRSAGVTKFPIRKMTAFALDGIVSFSSTPLRSLLWCSILLWIISVAFASRAMIAHFILHRTVPGWTSIVVLLTFFTGLNLFSLSVVGLYVGRIFEQGQRRPLYWCQAMRNFNEDALARAANDAPEVQLSRQINRS